MPNEIILVLSIAVLYALVVLFYRWFGKVGLYCWTVMATLLANIEVNMVVDAFGMEMTLGNILFATTFLSTDILSENEDKPSANTAVKLGIATSLVYVLVSQSWLYYTPNASDWASPHIHGLFANSPRLVLASLGVYAFVQFVDIILYHRIWDGTKRKTGDSKRLLWLRNNGSTLVSQMLNAILFNIAAFWGVYDGSTLFHIIISTYAIYVVTSVLDTAPAYAARRIAEKRS